MAEAAWWIRGGTVVTMDRTRRVAREDLFVANGRFVREEDARRLPMLRVLDATDALVAPGLVQTHVHLCQALFRGMADDLPLLAWLKERIWPLEAAHDAASLRASADLGLAEMLKAGTTTILDMGTVHHHDVVFEAMRDAGIRGASGKAMMDIGAGVPKGLRESTRASLRESLRLLERWHRSSGGRLHYAFAPRFVLSCSERLLRETARLANTHGAYVHTHAAEHAEERAFVRAELGVDDIEALERAGIAGPNVVIAHGVQLRRDEMKRIAARGTKFVHCPSANLKLASGVADVVAMREAGIVVGLGADGAPCNNRMDPWTELRQAALLAKAKRGSATALSASDALALLTIDGARVLGLDDEIGSIELGKRADVIVVPRERLHLAPETEPVAQLVYACTAADVRDVLVDGRDVMRDFTLRALDEAAVRTAALAHATRIRARAGL